MHENTADLFDSLGLEARTAEVRKRAERARAMLETALREAEVFFLIRSQRLACSLVPEPVSPSAAVLFTRVTCN